MASPQSKQQQQQPRKNLSMDECLFGPERKCPSNVWDAVLGGITPSSGSKTSESDDSSTTTPKTKKAAAEASSLSSCHPLEYLGIDDLEAGRWARPENASHHTIPLQELRRLSSQGISEQHRGVAWRVLLGGLPLETGEWKDFLLERRMEYRQLVADLFVEPQHDGNDLRGHSGKKKQQAQAKRDYEMKKGAANASPSTKNRAGVVDEESIQRQKVDRNSLPASASDLETNQMKNGSDRTHVNESDHYAGDDALTIEPVNVVDDSKERGTSHSKVPCDDDADADADGAIVEALLQDEQYGLIKTASAEELEDVFAEEETKSCESLADMVPMHIQEEWKKTGRDITTLDNMQNGHDVMNTLLVSTDAQARSTALISESDDTVSTESDAKWFQFFENASLLDEIRKDVVRTHPELHFFLEPENNLGQRRYAALERILFVWAKLNRGVRIIDVLSIHMPFWM